MAIATLNELKSHVNMSSTTTSEEAELQLCLDAAEGVVERHLRQVVSPRVVVEDHVVGRGGQLFLSSHPVTSVTSVTSVDGTRVWDVPSLAVDTTTGLVTGGYGSSLTGPVRITYQAGMQWVPPQVVLATLVVAAHLWEMQRPATLGGPSLGVGGSSEMSLTPSVYGYALPNRAIELLGPTPPVIA